MSASNDLQWEQFARLGEMIGDGLHNEPDGKWISREYKRLSELLIPEIKDMKSANRKLKAGKINEQVANLISKIKCKKDGCGGDLRQSRSGSKICYCKNCNARYKAVKSKN